MGDVNFLNCQHINGIQIYKTEITKQWLDREVRREGESRWGGGPRERERIKNEKKMKNSALEQFKVADQS